MKTFYSLHPNTDYTGFLDFKSRFLNQKGVLTFNPKPAYYLILHLIQHYAFPTDQITPSFSITVLRMASHPGANSFRGQRPLPWRSLPSSMYLRVAAAKTSWHSVFINLCYAKGNCFLIISSEYLCLREAPEACPLSVSEWHPAFQNLNLPSFQDICRGCCRCLLQALVTPRSAIILHSSGIAHSPVPMTPSSSPPMAPTSASRDIPFPAQIFYKFFCFSQRFPQLDNGNHQT